jgi:ubiquinone/menaquinone biosynthesis C-methylase UbiE
VVHAPAETGSALTRWLDRTLYPDFSSNWDDELLREVVLKTLAPSMIVLDLGAGRGAVPQMDFRGRVQQVIGIDPDPRVVDNPYLDQGIAGTGESMPFPDASFDLVVCDNVLEHISEPAAVLREVARVLKPGGRFIAKTPNRRHYMPLVARLTPTGFHRLFNRLRGRAESDTFRTRYRMNTPRALARLARAAGLEVQDIRLVEGRPEYLRISALTYPLGALYERIVNSTQRLAGFRIVMLATLSKPAVSLPALRDDAARASAGSR